MSSGTIEQVLAREWAEKMLEETLEADLMHKINKVDVSRLEGRFDHAQA